uniref:BAH domain-containing protein n=1 Tax=Physcomitrium patens TaxID=3218 RepID=A0A7I4ANN5_PHYPA
MAWSKGSKKTLDSYIVKGTYKVVEDPGKPPYVAKIEKIETDSKRNAKVRVRWYYRPEESVGGRRQFHDTDTTEGKFKVHKFKNHTKLESVGTEDYFCRFEYKASTGAFSPDRVAV